MDSANDNSLYYEFNIDIGLNSYYEKTTITYPKLPDILAKVLAVLTTLSLARILSDYFSKKYIRTKIGNIVMKNQYY